MRRSAIALVLALLVAGCTSQPVREGTDPEKSAALNAELGLRYMLQGKNDLALEKLERALRHDPESVEAHHYLAELYRRLDKPGKAEDHYREALGLDPKASAVRNNFAVFLCDRGDYDAAMRQFERVLDNPVYDKTAKVYENMGLCMRDKGEPERGEPYFRKALERDPELAKSLLAMAELSFQKGEALSARGYLQRYGAVTRHTPESLWLGVRVERELGDRDAMASYGMLLEGRFPDSVQTRRYREQVSDD